MAKKGANFERVICRQLSEWWTQGERDDVFWRSSQSGGRATMRARKGKRTAGSYGDICALDPVGEPFLRIFTLELKRGYSNKGPGDLLDCAGEIDCHPFMRALNQAFLAHQTAGSLSWALITKRDFRQASIFFPADLITKGAPLEHAKLDLIAPPVFRYRCQDYDFIGTPLEKFFECVNPVLLAETAKS